MTHSEGNGDLKSIYLLDIQTLHEKGVVSYSPHTKNCEMYA